jgi:hypothetical protein
VLPRGAGGLWLCQGQVGGSTVTWITSQDKTDGSAIACRKVVDLAKEVSSVVSVLRAFRVIESVGSLIP